MADIAEKTDRYEGLLAEALKKATVAAPGETPLAAAAEDCVEMARSYLKDGRHFRDEGDLVSSRTATPGSTPAHGSACSMSPARATCSPSEAPPPVANRPAVSSRLSTTHKPTETVCRPRRVVSGLDHHETVPSRSRFSTR